MAQRHFLVSPQLHRRAGQLPFSALIGHRLAKEEFGFANSTLDFIAFLGLPLQMVSTALIHYIAYFRGKNDDARLRGLLAGCQQFLLKTTIAGSILAILLANPLGHFFNFPRPSLMLAALICVLVGLWSGFAVALCQGMAWFKRLALIGLVAVAFSLLFGWVVHQRIPHRRLSPSPPPPSPSSPTSPSSTGGRTFSNATPRPFPLGTANFSTS